ncbi:hypothetical protein [Sulfuracidifex metallicus]|uniref:hypothetical protein n=1 Tax=Sulfuracidifex metallicus TaxID=47303 RepID=UPI000B0242E8|nr:hypothetical protein [Sulfuracidifex metallicus]
MCRMFAYYGSSSRMLNELISCLKMSSEKDPLNGRPHDSGWGYVIIKGIRLVTIGLVNQFSERACQFS